MRHDVPIPASVRLEFGVEEKRVERRLDGPGPAVVGLDVDVVFVEQGFAAFVVSAIRWVDLVVAAAGTEEEAAVNYRADQDSGKI